jgi:hypothetical protein
MLSAPPLDQVNVPVGELLSKESFSAEVRMLVPAFVCRHHADVIVKWNFPTGRSPTSEEAANSLSGKTELIEAAAADIAEIIQDLKLTVNTQTNSKLTDTIVLAAHKIFCDCEDILQQKDGKNIHLILHTVFHNYRPLSKRETVAHSPPDMQKTRINEIQENRLCPIEINNHLEDNLIVTKGDDEQTDELIKKISSYLCTKHLSAERKEALRDIGEKWQSNTGIRRREPIEDGVLVLSILSAATAASFTPSRELVSNYWDFQEALSSHV